MLVLVSFMFLNERVLSGSTEKTVWSPTKLERPKYTGHGRSATGWQQWVHYNQLKLLHTRSSTVPLISIFMKLVFFPPLCGPSTGKIYIYL